MTVPPDAAQRDVFNRHARARRLVELWVNYRIDDWQADVDAETRDAIAERVAGFLTQLGAYALGDRLMLPDLHQFHTTRIDATRRPGGGDLKPQ